MLEVIQELRIWDLKNELWSGALHTLDTIIQNDKLHELMDLLEDLFPEPVSLTTVNDLLWFDPEFIYEELKIHCE